MLFSIWRIGETKTVLYMPLYIKDMFSLGRIVERIKGLPQEPITPSAPQCECIVNAQVNLFHQLHSNVTVPKTHLEHSNS